MNKVEIIFGDNDLWRRDFASIDQRKRKPGTPVITPKSNHRIVKKFKPEPDSPLIESLHLGTKDREWEELECSRSLNQVETKKDRVCKIHLHSKCLEGAALFFKDSKIEERKTSKKDMEGLEDLPGNYWEVYLSMEGVSEKIGGRIPLKQECSRAKCECNGIKSLFVVKTPFRGRVFKYAATPYIPIRFVCPPSRHNVSYYILTIKLLHRPTGRALLGECYIHFRSRNYKKRIAVLTDSFIKKEEIKLGDLSPENEQESSEESQHHQNPIHYSSIAQDEFMVDLNYEDCPFRNIFDSSNLPNLLEELPVQSEATEEAEQTILDENTTLTDEEEMVLHDFLQILKV